MFFSFNQSLEVMKKYSNKLQKTTKTIFNEYTRIHRLLSSYTLIPTHKSQYFPAKWRILMSWSSGSHFFDFDDDGRNSNMKTPPKNLPEKRTRNTFHSKHVLSVLYKRLKFPKGNSKRLQKEKNTFKKFWSTNESFGSISKFAPFIPLA